MGSYSYDDANHLHAATFVQSASDDYSADYDASGNMTARAPSESLPQQQLRYDNEGRLAAWQSAPDDESPDTTTQYLYDGAGNRVEQLVTTNGPITTTTTYVVGGLEEISDNGTGSTLTKYFTGADGLPTAERVGTSGPLSYLATDGQRTVSEALDGSGNVTFQQLFDPYGKQRYAPSSGGIVYAGYDGLDRQLWRNTTNSPTGAYVAYSYDSTTGGNYGVGRLTGETFSGALGSGSYSYSYDRRGQTTASTMTVGSNSYPVGTTYNDAGQALMLTYPTGETVTAGYSAVGWLGSLTRTLGGNSTTLLGAISYTGSGGATGQMTSAQIGIATYSYSASFDTLARPTDVKTSRVSDGATLFEEAPTYDALGNITSETTTLPTGTDVQQFCYDDFSRLTWAGSTGTPPCTGTAITPGTLTAAQYTQSFSYDNQDRLRSSPLGSYSYDDPAHLHAATFVDSGTDDYSATYDASGNMLTRAPSESQSQQKLSYDNEGRLTAWQNAPSSPTSTAQYLYDGEGNRVEQQTVNSGTTTTTVYVGSLESVATTGGTSTTTTYYYAAGQRIALAVNGTLSYLASDLLGSANVTLNSSGTPTASQLYAPYGGVRYSNGTMPTDYGFTGQRADASTGLDYYGSRYYDPTLGQFTSADTVMDGQNRYGYVGGNPISHTDPSGNVAVLTPEQIGDIPGQTQPSVTSDVGDASGGDGTGGGPSLGNPDLTLWNDFEVYGGVLGFYQLQEDGLLHFVSTDVPYDGDGTVVWNQLTAPRSGPRSGPNLTATRETKPTGGSGGSAPQTQTGGGAGGSFGGGGGAAPASPGDDECGCGSTSGEGRTGSPANPLENVQYADRVQTAMGNRWASGDYFHAFPDIVDNYGALGEVSELPGGDGVVRTRLRIPGGYLSAGKPGIPFTGTWYDGVFEYIIEPDGVTVKHRFFNPC